MILQEFISEIVEEGEISIVVIGGTYTHAVCKQVKKGSGGEFRVQSDFGGTIQPYQPSPGEIQFAEHVVQVASKAIVESSRTTCRSMTTAASATAVTEESSSSSSKAFLPYYARVDFVNQRHKNSGENNTSPGTTVTTTNTAAAAVFQSSSSSSQPTLIELELIEPELWFRLYPKSAELLVEYILST